jgi:hypothetical protein
MERNENFGLLRTSCVGRTFEVREQTFKVGSRMIDGECSKLNSEHSTRAWEHLILPPQPILWCIGYFKYFIYPIHYKKSHISRQF